MSKITITNKGETPFAAEAWGAFVDLPAGVRTVITNPFKGCKVVAKPVTSSEIAAAENAGKSDEDFATAILHAYPHRNLVLEREEDGATISAAVPTKSGHVIGGGDVAPVLAPLAPAPEPEKPKAPETPAKAPKSTKPAPKPAKGKGK